MQFQMYAACADVNAFTSSANDAACLNSTGGPPVEKTQEIPE